MITSAARNPKKSFIKDFNVSGVTQDKYNKHSRKDSAGGAFPVDIADRIANALDFSLADFRKQLADQEAKSNDASNPGSDQADLTSEAFCRLVAEADIDEKPTELPSTECSGHCQMAHGLLNITHDKVKLREAVLANTAEFAGNYSMAMKWHDGKVGRYKVALSLCRCGVTHFEVTKYYQQRPQYNSRGFAIFLNNALNVHIIEKNRHLTFGFICGSNTDVRPIVGALLDCDSTNGGIEVNKTILIRDGSEAGKALTREIVEELLMNEAEAPSGVLLCKKLWPGE